MSCLSVLPLSLCPPLPDARVAPKSPLYKGSHALLIGVSNHNNGRPRLESISGEMKKLAAALKQGGFEVEKVMGQDG